MHNYAKFYNLKNLLVNNSIENGKNDKEILLKLLFKIYKENYELKNFFLNKLNGNSIELKRLFNYNNDILNYLIDNKRLLNLTSFEFRWRKTLVND